VCDTSFFDSIFEGIGEYDTKAGPTAGPTATKNLSSGHQQRGYFDPSLSVVESAQEMKKTSNQPGKVILVTTGYQLVTTTGH